VAGRQTRVTCGVAVAVVAGFGYFLSGIYRHVHRQFHDNPDHRLMVLSADYDGSRRLFTARLNNATGHTIPKASLDLELTDAHGRITERDTVSASIPAFSSGTVAVSAHSDGATGFRLLKVYERR
jgi:hypothetical protein